MYAVWLVECLALGAMYGDAVRGAEQSLEIAKFNFQGLDSIRNY